MIEKNVVVAGIQHIVLAMPHRGRLNLLTDLLQYPPAALFHKITGAAEIPEKLGADGDVISHLGRLFPVIFFS
jgi:probable 2-oxoglutarate dehydrogenase E1 component DHKTD1